jgi:hypothetical protein
MLYEEEGPLLYDHLDQVSAYLQKMLLLTSCSEIRHPGPQGTSCKVSRLSNNEQRFRQCCRSVNFSSDPNPGSLNPDLPILIPIQ